MATTRLGQFGIGLTGYGAFQPKGEAVVVPPVADAVAVPAGAPGRHRRRRYIMPDGTMLEATTQEAYEWLRRYSRPIEQPRQAKSAQPSSIRMPAIKLEKRDVRFIPAQDATADTWKAVISERFAFTGPPEATRQAQERLNRMRADEEAITVLLM